MIWMDLLINILFISELDLLFMGKKHKGIDNEIN